MCINKLLYIFFYKEKCVKETQTPTIMRNTHSTQTEENKISIITQTELNMENFMDTNNEDWYKLVWTNPTHVKDQLIDFKY